MCLSAIAKEIFLVEAQASVLVSSVLQFGLFVLGAKLSVSGIAKWSSGKSTTLVLFIPGFSLFCLGISLQNFLLTATETWPKFFLGQLIYFVTAAGIAFIAHRLEIGEGYIPHNH